MKVYLDVCAIQRPLDTPTQIRILLEAEAVLGLLTLGEKGDIELVSSVALIYEIEKNPHPLRKEHARAIVSKAKFFVPLSEAAQKRAEKLVENGFKPLDALHLALAEIGAADFFCTCDDDVLRKARRVRDLQVRVVSPLDLVKEIEK